MYKRFNLTNNIYVKCIYISIDLHVAICSIQNYVIKFVSDLRQVGGFSGTSVSATNKICGHYIAEILLKLVLKPRALTLFICLHI